MHNIPDDCAHDPQAPWNDPGQDDYFTCSLCNENINWGDMAQETEDQDEKVCQSCFDQTCPECGEEWDMKKCRHCRWDAN